MGGWGSGDYERENTNKRRRSADISNGRGMASCTTLRVGYQTARNFYEERAIDGEEACFC